VKIDPRKILLHSQATVDGSIAFDGEKFVFEGKANVQYLQRKIEEMREELGVDNPSPEELFRYMVFRTYTNTNGAIYAPGDGPEISPGEFVRESVALKGLIARRARAAREQQARKSAM
jgi:hypothetical protein